MLNCACVLLVWRKLKTVPRKVLESGYVEERSTKLSLMQT